MRVKHPVVGASGSELTDGATRGLAVTGEVTNLVAVITRGTAVGGLRLSTSGVLGGRLGVAVGGGVHEELGETTIPLTGVTVGLLTAGGHEVSVHHVGHVFTSTGELHVVESWAPGGGVVLRTERTELRTLHLALDCTRESYGSRDQVHGEQGLGHVLFST